MSDITEDGDQAVDWVAEAISRYRYNPGYQWRDMTERQRDWLRGEALVAINAFRETAAYMHETSHEKEPTEQND